MNIILDTHIFIWTIAQPEKLNANWHSEIESRANTVYVSAISIAEITIKASLGKLNIDFDPVEIAVASGFELLDFSSEDAMQLLDMPYHHRDPFDRMLIAQAIANDYQLITSDNKFSPYDCKLLG